MKQSGSPYPGRGIQLNMLRARRLRDLLDLVLDSFPKAGVSV